MLIWTQFLVCTIVIVYGGSRRHHHDGDHHDCSDVSLEEKRPVLFMGFCWSVPRLYPDCFDPLPETLIRQTHPGECQRPCSAAATAGSVPPGPTTEGKGLCANRSGACAGSKGSITSLAVADANRFTDI